MQFYRDKCEFDSDIQQLFEKADSKAVDNNSKILINNIISNIVDLSYSLKNHVGKLSLNTHNKMEIYRDNRIRLLESYVNGLIMANDLKSKLTSDDLSITQTDRRRFLACSLAMVHFDDRHPIKETFLDVINFQRIIAMDMPYQYSQILGNFKRNLELMSELKITQIEIPKHQIIDKPSLIITIQKFNTEEDLDKAFINLQNDICKLTRKEEPIIDDTINIYYQIAFIGINDPQFVFKFLTTCEGLDNYEQDKFMNITYIKTSILSMMNMIDYN